VVTLTHFPSGKLPKSFIPPLNGLLIGIDLINSKLRVSTILGISSDLEDMPVFIPEISFFVLDSLSIEHIILEE
jgi:hypothetical protein